MGKRRKLNKLKIGIVMFFIVFTISIVVFGRYIYNAVLESYFTARQFYFTSDILVLNGDNQVYTYDNWGGIGEFDEIVFDLYSYNNELSKLDYDLNYTVTCQALDSDKITCSIQGADGATSTTGTIYATTNTSKVTILVNPVDGVTISEGDTVSLLVTASTTEPYQKTISRKISLHINLPEGNSYTIEDEAYNEYAILKLVNRSEAATEVTLEFDPDELRLDLNDEIYTDSENLVSVTTPIGSNYINKIVFNIGAETSKNVKFYKVDISQNYSYQGSGAESAITVTY